jgi:hypothetical protein
VVVIRLLSPVEACLHIPADRDTVWAIVSNPRTYPDWLVGAQEMRAVDPDFPAPGSALHHSVGPTAGATVDDDSVATAVAPPHYLELEVHVGPLSADVELHLREVPEGTEVRFRERPNGVARAFTPFIRPVLHARNARSLQQLRDLITR